MKIDQMTGLEVTGHEPIRWHGEDMALTCYSCHDKQAKHHLSFGNDVLKGKIQVCQDCLKKYLSGELEP